MKTPLEVFYVVMRLAPGIDYYPADIYHFESLAEANKKHKTDYVIKVREVRDEQKDKRTKRSRRKAVR